MKAGTSLLALIALLLLPPSPGLAMEGQLMLSKEQLFDSGPAIDFHPTRGNCEALFYVDAGKDIPDMRRDFRNYYCQGMYTLTLDGPPGTLVTLFGGFNFGQERGFLILKKKDDQKIWVLHLEDFPAGRWVTQEATSNYGVKYGAYEAYYQPAPNFRRNVSSVKWGAWWGEGDLLKSTVR